MCKKKQPFVNICDGIIAYNEIVRNILTARKVGEDPMAMFFTQFTTTGPDVTSPKRPKYNEEAEGLPVHQPARKEKEASNNFRRQV